MKIDNFEIGSGKTFIIAELSANHNQNKDIAIDTIKAAKKAGADAIKLQTYTADTITIDCKSDCFKIKEGLWKGKTLYELYQEAYTPWEWHQDLFKVARNEGLICFSSPFDKTAVDFLEQFDVPAYKIASFEIQDVPLIEYAASKGKPMIISTGIAEFEDIELAIKTCRKAGNDQIVLLKCTSAYPAPIDEANLVMIPEMKETFGVEIGLSDHTLGITVPVVATVLGASIIEKHFILSKSVGGPDSSFSLDQGEFFQMVKSVREAEKSIGKVDYKLSAKALKSKQLGRSLFVVENMKKGDIISINNVCSIRPGYGLHPKYYPEILGKKVIHNIEKGTPFKLEFILG